MTEQVQWAKEVINTCTENLQLDDLEESFIRVAQAGVYELCFAFFVPSDAVKPSVQVRVND